MENSVAETDTSTFTKPIIENGRYKNPWKTWKEPVFSNLLKMIFSAKDNSQIPGKTELNKTLPVEKPDFDKLRNPPQNGIQTMWIGHASVLVQFDGISVLTDPVFSDRSSFTQLLGPKRYRPTPCRIEDIPSIDAVVISHNHYDHLDYNSVLKLNAQFGDNIWWFVPEGTKQWMINAGCKNVVQLSWWEEAEYPKNTQIKFACTPSQHWCRRSVTDTNKALWGSWVIKGPRFSFFFAGDTGYCEGFKQIGKKYGPIDYAAIPIGAYEPRWFMKPQHVDPEEAVQVHEDIQARYSLGIHWGTFKLTYEHYLEPKTKLAAELKVKGFPENCFFTLPHGHVHTVTEK